MDLWFTLDTGLVWSYKLIGWTVWTGPKKSRLGRLPLFTNANIIGPMVTTQLLNNGGEVILKVEALAALVFDELFPGFCVRVPLFKRHFLQDARY